MRRDVLRRVRWGNLALACTVLIALVIVVVWPLVSSTPPQLPPDAARPLIAAASPAITGEASRDAPSRGPRARAKTGRSAGKTRAGHWAKGGETRLQRRPKGGAGETRGARRANGGAARTRGARRANGGAGKTRAGRRANGGAGKTRAGRRANG